VRMKVLEEKFEAQSARIAPWLVLGTEANFTHDTYHDELLFSHQSLEEPIAALTERRAESLPSQHAEYGLQKEELVQFAEKENNEGVSSQHRISNAKYRSPLQECVMPNQQDSSPVGFFQAPLITREGVEQNAKAGVLDKVLEGIPKPKINRDAMNTAFIKKKIESVRNITNRSGVSELQQTVRENIQNCGAFRPKLLSKMVKCRNVQW